MATGRILWASLAAAALAAAAWSGARGSEAVTAKPQVGLADCRSEGLSLLETALATLKANPEGQVVLDVFVSNGSGGDLVPSLTPFLRTAQGRAIDVTARGGARVPGGSVRRVSLLVSLPPLDREEYPLSGWLLLSGAQSSQEPGHKLEIKAVAGPDGAADWPLILRSLAWACICLLAAGLVAVASRDWGVLLRRMGTPTWAFTESWSSTLTIGGAFLTSILGFAALPDQGHTFSKSSYTLLSLLSAALIGLAPGVYSLFRAPVQVRTDATNVTIQYQGVVALFLVAGVFTMTGVLAQLSLLGSLFSDLATAGLMSVPAAAAFRRLSVMLQFALGIYAVISAAQTVIYQSAQKKVTPEPGKGVGGRLREARKRLRKVEYLLRPGSVSAHDARAFGDALPDWRLL